MLPINFEDVRKAGGLELLARQMVEGFITGLHKSPYHGFSVEFAEHRLYNEGQSTRHIDWKVFARTDRLYTKQYEEETNLRCLIALDCSPSMYYPQPGMDKMKFSVYSAAALSYLLTHQRDAVGLALFSDHLEELTSIKSTPAHLDKLFKLLDQRLNTTAKQKPTRIAEVLHTLAEKIHKRSLVLIFSDMFEGEDQEEIFKALQHLKHNKHEVLLFHITDHETELAFNFEERPYEFIDLESGEKLKLNPMEVKESFVKQLTVLHNELKMKCNQLKIDFISANAKLNYYEVLQAYLIKRAKMK
ncbi:MAG TPA: DUF58 domain-containing protein [Cyclobacteriaceae bacterium]|jgi:uncharacterized protein (DUF58 family)|nr:DUF58 domain-containing protein [Cyclobacteriaceae bacterium]